MKSVQIHDPEKGNECVIMVVDEDEAMRAVLVEALQEKGCCIVEYHDGKGALQGASVHQPSGHCHGFEDSRRGICLFTIIASCSSDEFIVVMTAHGDSQSKDKALECGAKGYLEKPLHLNDLKEWISTFCPIKICRNSL